MTSVSHNTSTMPAMAAARNSVTSSMPRLAAMSTPRTERMAIAIRRRLGLTISSDEDVVVIVFSKTDL
ncbi:MAG TPA: hypothetical protein VF595_10170 [Tepidisphaeraceae bacterium]|jgi:hypothetical protein